MSNKKKKNEHKSFINTSYEKTLDNFIKIEKKLDFINYSWLSIFHRIYPIDEILQGHDVRITPSNFEERINYYLNDDIESFNDDSKKAISFVKKNHKKMIDIHYKYFTSKQMKEYDHIEWFFKNLSSSYNEIFKELINLINEKKETEIFYELEEAGIFTHFEIIKKYVSYFNSFNELSLQKINTKLFLEHLSDFLISSNLIEVLSKILFNENKSTWKEIKSIYVNDSITNILNSNLLNDIRDWRNYFVHNGFEYDSFFEGECNLYASVMFPKISCFMNMKFLVQLIKNIKDK
ncbi:MAG: hypothetical protein K4H23_04465 [Mollicutes bacterium PWAP]|nr:hypothetical protein [Mollicutes bacterium PWAP]